MSLSVNNSYFPKNNRPSKKMTEAYKEIIKEKKKNHSKTDKVDISELGKKWTGLSKNQLQTLNNMIELNDPYEDYAVEVGSLDFVTADGVIQWTMPNESVDDLKSICQEVSVKDYLFWNSLASDPASLGLRFSDKEIRDRLSNVGIQSGFFTVSVGQRSSTNFLTQSKGAFAVHSKAQYDQQYNYISSENYLKQFATGQKFLIDEIEYTLGEDRKLNVPYGADIYKIKKVNS